MDEIEELLKALISQSSSTVVKKLSALNKICEEQFDRGSIDFSVTTIGKIAESQDLMKTQSIRNKSGEKYKSLIDVWAKNYSGPKQKSIKEAHDWIDQIPDHQTKWLVRDMATELTRLRGEVNVLKSVDRNIYINSDNNGGKEKNKSAILTVLSEPDYEALVEGISDKNLSNFGLIKGELGEIKNEDNLNIMPFGFVAAIEKIIGLEEED